MDKKTRQLYFQFLESLSEGDFELINLEHLAASAEEYLAGTELHEDAMARIGNAIRFLESSEGGAATFEIKSLYHAIKKQLAQDL